jgi:flagellar hook protein FlgE
MGFQQGLSGLNAASKNLDAIGNNVANTTTVGFKQSRAEFSDVYAASLSGAGSGNIGLGTQVAAVTQQFTQGNITATNNPMDVAINGRGFFRMSQNGSISYTRNGQFQMDKNNYIVDARGLQLTGFAVNATTGVLDTSTPVPIQLNTGDQDPRVTGGGTTKPGVNGQLNLDSRNKIIPPAAAVMTPAMTTAAATVDTAVGLAAVVLSAPPSPAADALSTLGNITAAANTAAGLVPAIPADEKNAAISEAAAIISAATTAANAALADGTTTKAAATAVTPATLVVDTSFNYQDPTTFNQSTSLAVYDQQGNPYSQTLFFKKTDINTWEVYSTLTNPDGVVTPLPPPAAQTLTAILLFNANGTLAATVPTPATATVPAGGFVLTGTSFTYPVSFTGTSQFGSSFGVNALSQDGFSSGKLTGTSIGPDGSINGRYTNGQTKVLGQVTLTNFQNPQGLQPQGNNQWGETAASGNAVPVAGVAGTGSLGVLQASAVEDSNVDLTAELVNMITAQRVYQANAQTIKTQDQVLQTLVNLR